MKIISNTIGHFKTISTHRRLVRQGCFRIGLYYQGIAHDLSKYMPSEFFVGAKYYQGYRSPNNAEREAIGYSSAWLHHKGRNKHHYEYWVDYSSTVGRGVIPVRMPNRYIAEMFMDRVAASKIYNGKDYKDDYPLKYYLKGKDHIIIEEHTKKELEYLLRLLADKGEDVCDEYIMSHLLKGYSTVYIARFIKKRRNLTHK